MQITVVMNFHSSTIGENTNAAVVIPEEYPVVTETKHVVPRFGGQHTCKSC